MSLQVPFLAALSLGPARVCQDYQHCMFRSDGGDFRSRLIPLTKGEGIWRRNCASLAGLSEKVLDILHDQASRRQVFIYAEPLLHLVRMVSARVSTLINSASHSARRSGSRWTNKMSQAAHVNMTAFEEGLGRVMYVVGAPEHERPLPAPPQVPLSSSQGLNSAGTCPRPFLLVIPPVRCSCRCNHICRKGSFRVGRRPNRWVIVSQNVPVGLSADGVQHHAIDTPTASRRSSSDW